MPAAEATTTYLELRESTPDGREAIGLSHSSKGLVLVHVLELASRGEPRGVVTVVHDAGEHGGRHRPLAEALAEAGWAVALPDLRGHGRSEGARGHSAGRLEVLRDLDEVQSHVAYRLPEAPKVLVGHGLGALWAAEYALERPGAVAALVLSAPLLEPRFVAPEPPRGLGRLWKRVGPESEGRLGWSEEDLLADPAAREERRRDELVHERITLRAIEEASAAAREVWPRLGELSVPTLVFHGGEDPLVDAEAVRRLAAPRLVHERCEGRRHDLWHDGDPTALFARVDAFLGEALGG